MVHLNTITVCALISCLFSNQHSIHATFTYETRNLTMPLDHFNFDTNATFELRYLVNETFWRAGGPIFFYTGNEGSIETFAQNTGFMWEIAPEYNAMLIFAEHRYYGKSLPFQDKSYADIKHLGYLSSTQALADYAYLLDHLQTEVRKKYKNRWTKKGKSVPVYAFGGSYGGMLAAWMRLKYPWLIHGSLASSAPVFQFQGLTNCNTFSNVVANVFKASTLKGICVENIKNSWKSIDNITSSQEGRDWLTHEWKLCRPLNNSDDVKSMKNAMIDIYGNVAMINYPYPTDFLAPVPAHPVRVMCEYLENHNLEGKPLLTAIGHAIGVFTNYTGTTKCLDVSNVDGSMDDDGWDFQACSEIVMPMCTDTGNMMFEATPWDLKTYAASCRRRYGLDLVVRDDIVRLEYGGKAAPYTNVIFTNGLLDPWSPGGVWQTDQHSVYLMAIPDAAHHLDLRASNPADPAPVVQARDLIKNILHMWIKSYAS